MRKKKTKKNSADSIDTKTKFSKAAIMGPESLLNPLKKGIYGSAGGNRRRLVPMFLEIDGEKVRLSTTNIACLAAIANGFDYGYAIRKAYEWKHATVHYSLVMLAVNDLIEPKSGSWKNRYEESSIPFLPHRAMFKLTGRGEAVIKLLKETKNAFFAECEAWLGARKTQNTP